MNKQERIKELEAELERLMKPEFKEGDWVKSITDPGFLLLYNGDASTPQTGFNRIYRWVESGINGLIGTDLSRFRPATPDEIKSALIEEAERRGYVAGVQVISAMTGNTNKVGTYPHYCPEKDSLCLGYPSVYYKGKWAEIITKPKITVNGYDAEFKDGYVQFGCARIDNRFFTDMAENQPWEFEGKGRGNRTMTAVKIGEGLFDIETIKRINEEIGS